MTQTRDERLAKNRIHSRVYCALHREEVNARNKACRTSHPVQSKAASKAWHILHKEEANAQRKAYRLAHYDEEMAKDKARTSALRKEVLRHYGGRCACCGEATPEFFEIDHINGGGNWHRKKINKKGGKSFYIWLKKNNFPPEFQVLCSNCNHAKGCYGACPHTLNLLPKRKI